MSSKEKPEHSFQAYLRDVSVHDVPSHEQEIESFRRLEELETQLVRIFLKREGAEASLREAAEKEEVKLPKDLSDDHGLNEAVRFARLTEQGREWFHSQVRLPKRGPVGKLNRERDEIKSQFVSANLRLAVSIAKKYSRFCKHQTFGDVVQEGNIGLMKAVDRFDRARGYRFVTYASWWIRAHIKRAIADKEGLIRVPVHMADLGSKLNRIDSAHMAEMGESMDAEQLAKASKAPLEKVRTLLASRVKLAYLDSPVGEEETMTLVDTVVSEAFPSPLEEVSTARLRDALTSMMDMLTPTERKIIMSRFGFEDPERELTLQELGDEYDVSRERIRQIEAKALGKLRFRMGKRRMDDYLLNAM